jgi:uncharacterized membrane protein
MVLMVTVAVLSGASNVGAVVFIWPVSIILGVGPQSFLAIVLAVALTILGVILFFVFFKQKEK